MRLVDLSGLSFGRLTVIGRVANRGRHVYWTCRCECGGVTESKGDHLKAGAITSCGCVRACSDGQSVARVGRPSPTYKSWQSMIERTSNPNHHAWRHYGGRGIAVSDRWRTSPGFLADMGERPAGLTLDRIDNDGDYEPGNCRWATVLDQNRNKRQRRTAA